jgi:hypothetical protein
MKAIHSQSSLIAGLALSLGASLMFILSPGTAKGYPTEAVSYGTNPIWSIGGAIQGDGSVILTTVPLDQSLVVTDVVLAASGNSPSCSSMIQVGLGNGASSSLDTDSLGRFSVGMARDQASYAQNRPIQTGVAHQSSARWKGGWTFSRPAPGIGLPGVRSPSHPQHMSAALILGLPTRLDMAQDLDLKVGLAKAARQVGIAGD